MDEYICHCFRHTRQDIEKDVSEHGSSTIMERIAAAKAASGCNCEHLNPKSR